MSFSNRSVLPSYLSARFMGENSASPGQGDTTELMIGEVKGVIEPTDPRSMSKAYREYSVDVIYQKDSGIASTVRFEHCLLMNPFGGVADKCVYSLRADPKEPETHKTTTTGSKVLLLCVSGMSHQAFIIGGVRSDYEKDVPGHTYQWQFNGVSQSVANDGSWSIQFQGPTDAAGNVAEDLKVHAPTTIGIAANGNFEVSTKDRNQYFLVSHENKNIMLHADTGLSINSNANMALESGDDAFISSEKNVTVTAQEKVTISSAGVKVGSGREKWAMFSTYRKEQTKLHTKLQAQLLAAAAVVGPTAVLAPFFTQMAAAIAEFEAKSYSYLSRKNSND